MKRFILAFSFLLLACTGAMAQEEKGIDQLINEKVAPATEVISNIVFVSFEVAEGISIPFILVWLLFGALFFTLYLKFINIRGFGRALQIVKGKYSSEDDPGEVTHFQALTAALSGTVGLGNIAGVAIAVSLGGPGATFWMIIAGLLGMSSKFTECTLAVKFRDVHADGSVSGGPMHYLRKGFANKGFGGIGMFLAGFFAIMCIGGSFGGGNMFQVNQAAQQFVAVTGGPDTYIGQNTWVFGVIMAVLVAIVIIGGIQSIAKVTEKIVPIMCAVYVLGALIVLGANFTAIPAAFGAIIDGAFNGSAVAGGIVGTLIQGIRRAAFSNEAGVGSAAIAHSAVKTRKPVTEGFVASLEPFVDTVVVCTITALVIIISGTYTMETSDGIAITSAAFASVIEWFPLVLAVAVMLFAFSTMISWSYYGLKSWTFLFGKSHLSELSYKFIFCCFVVLGAATNLQAIVDFSDAMIFAMSFPNLIGLYVLAPLVKKELNEFVADINNKETKEKVSA
ncbi:alanine/glycine:cation symporter family protein [Roseivirga sp. BDSF3-8]|uniref:alanine/glycine:cation symporter family protein n=1 Tax=Roseivirga sp. BDSF3-8 TaxID=3241598 RepID=UPI0035323A4D